MVGCWAQDPGSRPSFTQVSSDLSTFTSGSHDDQAEETTPLQNNGDANKMV